MGDVTDARDAVMEAAVKQHDLLYGRDHCDRKYLTSCHRMPEIILALPKGGPVVEEPEAAAACAVFDALMLVAEREARHDLARWTDLPPSVQTALAGMIRKVAPTLVRFGREYAPDGR